jgi:hypothetical protein
MDVARSGRARAYDNHGTPLERAPLEWFSRHEFCRRGIVLTPRGRHAVYRCYLMQTIFFRSLTTALGRKRIKASAIVSIFCLAIHYIIASCIYCAITVISARATTKRTRDSGNRIADDSDDVDLQQTTLQHSHRLLFYPSVYTGTRDRTSIHNVTSASS